MVKKITINFNYQIMLFLISLFLVFTSINLFYLSSEAPDYIFYNDYFDYFFQEEPITGRENGLLYFFLVSCIIKLQAINITPATELHYISNSIHIVNFLLYIIGLFGLYKLLLFKKFLKNNIFLSFSILNFMPFTIKLLSTMKPEILAFAFLPWCLFCIEMFLKSQNFNYLYWSIFPNTLLLSTKNSIIATVATLYLFIILRNLKLFNNIKFLKVALFFLFFYFFILYEDYLSNGYFVLNHIPDGGPVLIPEEERVNLSFIYNINFFDLIQKPYRHNHANSFIGIAFLDLFGDYFQWYSNNTKSLYMFDNYAIQGFWYFGNVKELVGLFLGIFTYILIFKYSKENKSLRLYITLPFFSFFVFLINIFIRREYFDTSKASAFKSHYYSYLFVITFAFLLLCFLRKQNILKHILLIFLVLTSVYLHGFFKTTYTNTLEYLSVKNNVSQFCDINKLIFNFENPYECNNYIQKLCNPNFILFDLRYVFNDSDVIHSNYPLELINNEKENIIVENFESCLKYVKIGYTYKSIYLNQIKIPWINFLYLIFSILGFYKLNKLYKNEN